MHNQCLCWCEKWVMCISSSTFACTSFPRELLIRWNSNQNNGTIIQSMETYCEAGTTPHSSVTKWVGWIVSNETFVSQFFRCHIEFWHFFNENQSRIHLLILLIQDANKDVLTFNVLEVYCMVPMGASSLAERLGWTMGGSGSNRDTARVPN